jgi:predicted RNA-binding Zn-ribbon protein involved in translation (DUF1610 family)
VMSGYRRLWMSCSIFHSANIKTKWMPLAVRSHYAGSENVLVECGDSKEVPMPKKTNSPNSEIMPGRDFVLVVDNDYITRTSPTGDKLEKVYDGLPLKCLAISWPFMLCRMGTETHAVDLRRCTVVKAQRTYVAAFYKHHAAKQENGDYSGGPRMDSRGNPVWSQPPGVGVACPKCGGRMRKEPTAGAEDWHYVCSACGVEAFNPDH